jgi:hypothetical protein
VPSLDGHCPPGVSLSPIALHHPNLPRETDRSPLHTSRLVWLLLPGAVTRHRHLPPRSASTAGPSPTEVGTESRCFATGSCLSRRSAPATEAADPFPRGLLPPAPGPASGSAGLAPAFPFRLSRTPRAVGLASCPFPRMPKHPGLGTETPSVPAPRPRHAGLARGPKPAACLAHRGSSHRATL